LAIALAIFLIFLGGSVSRLAAWESQCCNVCSYCKGQHEATEDRARAEEARMRGQQEAAEYLARADRAIQKGNQKAAKYEAKANAHLASETTVFCNACGDRVVTTSSKGQHEAAEDRARAEKARMHAQRKAAEYRARADEAIQEGNQKAAEYEAKANAHLEECARVVTCNTCAPVICDMCSERERCYE
jgi:hypothetical protein